MKTYYRPNKLYDDLVLTVRGLFLPIFRSVLNVEQLTADKE